MRLAAILPAVLASVGCATTFTTPEKPIPVASEARDVVVALGAVRDTRLKEKDGTLEQKQIRIGAAKVKNVIADVLTRSGRFRQVVNLPLESEQEALSRMLEAARTANAHYLVVGEIDQFDVTDLGANKRTIASVILEGLTFPVGCVVYLLSGRRNGIWVNGALYDRTAKGEISVSLHVIETENGKVVGHVSNVTSEATKPVNALVYGDLDNPDDDWVDIGKELGAVALHNLAVDLIGRLDAELERVGARK